MAKKLSLDDYLGIQGLSSPISDYMIDKMKIPHGLTGRQQKKLEKETLLHSREYSARRQAAITEYNRLVEIREIIPKTRMEQTLERAVYGHPDNESTQAARRICEKKGIDWQAYQKDDSSSKFED